MFEEDSRGMTLWKYLERAGFTPNFDASTRASIAAGRQTKGFGFVEVAS